MQPKLPKIVQHSGELSEEALERLTDLLIVLGPAFERYRTLPFGDLIASRMAREVYRPRESAQPFTTVLPNRTGTRVSLAVYDAAKSAFDRLTLARRQTAAHPLGPQTRLAVACYGDDDGSVGEPLIAALLAAAFVAPDYRSRRDPVHRLRSIDVFGDGDTYMRTRAEAQGNNLARFLTTLPPNELTPGQYRRKAQGLARDVGWTSEFLDHKKLAARGAGAFLAVAQGSPDNDAGILHLRYAPRRRTAAPPLALVGKGICFDTGGTNLKTAKGMYGMHEDMEGSAVALGVLLALTELAVDFPVDCWLALAQNHIGPAAYKPNDVVTAANDTTIEIVHTDAEGRMVLADTLVFASARKPRMIIDYATLTGAYVQALSTRMSGAVTNRDPLIPALIAAGQSSGERVWPFPLSADYADELKSDIADTKQCTLGNEADQILAAAFLQKFVAPGIPWVHLDLAAGNHKGGLAHIPTDITGFGVRFTLNLLFDQDVLALL